MNDVASAMAVRIRHIPKVAEQVGPVVNRMVEVANKGSAVERLPGVHIGSAADTAVVVDNSSAVTAVVVRLGMDPSNDSDRMGFGDHCLMEMDTVPPVAAA